MIHKIPDVIVKQLEWENCKSELSEFQKHLVSQSILGEFRIEPRVVEGYKYILYLPEVIKYVKNNVAYVYKRGKTQKELKWFAQQEYEKIIREFIKNDIVICQP